MQEQRVIKIYRRLFLTGKIDPRPVSICEFCADSTGFDRVLRKALRFGVIKRIITGMGICARCQDLSHLDKAA